MILKHKKSRLAALLMAAAAALFSAGCTENSDESAESSETSNSIETEAPEVTGELTITGFKVGKADAFVIQTENTVTVVDTGLKGDGKDIEEFLEAQGIDKIDVMMITHFDKDHVGGAARLVNRMEIDTIYVPDYTSEAEDYLSFMEKVNEKQKELSVMSAGSQAAWTFDDVAFQLYAANETDYGKDEENDFSLVLYMKHGENTFLFTGDAEQARTEEILALNLGKVDFLKFPYHGHYLPTTEALLDACDPSVTVVTCSKKEDADDSTYETLENRGIEAYYTKNGTVTIISDGKTLNCSQETVN